MLNKNISTYVKNCHKTCLCCSDLKADETLFTFLSGFCVFFWHAFLYKNFHSLIYLLNALVHMLQSERLILPAK